MPLLLPPLLLSAFTLQQSNAQLVDQINREMINQLPPPAGFPVERLSRAETVAGFFGLGLYWGNARSQNAAGHVVRGKSVDHLLDFH